MLPTTARPPQPGRLQRARRRPGQRWPDSGKAEMGHGGHAGWLRPARRRPPGGSSAYATGLISSGGIRRGRCAGDHVGARAAPASVDSSRDVRSRSWGCAVPAEDQDSAPALFALAHGVVTSWKYTQRVRCSRLAAVDRRRSTSCWSSASAVGASPARQRGLAAPRPAGPRRIGRPRGPRPLAGASWEDDSPGRPPQEIPLPEDLPTS
jgi:hypothetical protein